MRGAFFLVLVLWTAAGGAQTTYKCVNAQRAITYSNILCEKQGLKDAGPVSDRTTTMPFVQPEQKTAPRKETPKPASPVIEKPAK